MPKLVSGECVGTLAVAEDLLAPTEDNIKCECKDEKLSGTKIAVPDAAIATHAVVVCRGNAVIELRLVDLNSHECKFQLEEKFVEIRVYFYINFIVKVDTHLKYIFSYISTIFSIRVHHRKRIL